MNQYKIYDNLKDALGNLIDLTDGEFITNDEYNQIIISHTDEAVVTNDENYPIMNSYSELNKRATVTPKTIDNLAYNDDPNYCISIPSVDEPPQFATESRDDKLKIMSWNIQGIGSKLDMNDIWEIIYENDIIFLYETMKLNSLKPDLKEYQYVHCQRSFKHPRARRPAGGLAVIFKNTLSNLV